MKHLKKILLVIIPFAFLTFVMYLLFRNHYHEILIQLQKADKKFLIILAAIGIAYEFVDAVIMGRIVRIKTGKISFVEMLQLIFLGVFMNITTYGTGIKPAQTYCLAKKGVNPGKAFCVLTLPYVYHKTAIVLYATIMLLLQHSFLKAAYADSFHYLFAGYIFSILIILILIFVCSSKTVSDFLCCLIQKIPVKEKWEVKKDKIMISLESLQKESEDIVREKKTWFIMVCGDMLKMTLWYILPFIAYLCVGGTADAVSFIAIVATSAFMQLIIGVIPTAGGMVSTEVVYTLLFSRLFGMQMALSTLILYRVATYYLPFIISIVVVFTMKMYKK